MKKIALLALAASTAAIATPSMAQTITGTINISGTVANKCSVVGGAGAPTAFGTTINMGELADTDGTLLPSATLQGTFGTQTAGANIARVVCTTLNPTVAIDADPLVNSTSAPLGYVNTVHFDATATVSKSGGTTATFVNASTGSATAAAPLGGALAATGNNVTITTSNWHTISNSGQQLVAGTYNNGKIVVTIAPL